MERSPHDRGPSSHYFDFTEDEVEFMKAIESWKKVHHVRFPKYSDILSVVKSLGYIKQGSAKDES